ncbi:Acetyltransferase (GNAT) family protein [Saccharopolyspora antimicrobica]|uniref:Acetyltransferase (GNAT) family protein n=1 Tax=Saccharopolyspora antimicrobica TaxID=455193 RepID=A0A1I4VBK6_9PSEU|nr:GNAT family N-acetyltransferase [Saccharopolyspora antimicrobica]RKT86215.1 acetyltransferase (GNAT) family protein [Saccharopolyspora antimicrobica]SFM98601.1 Acetyltransferase (GNAT) family protein [Saccharopolyspora antimicrobica]
MIIRLAQERDLPGFLRLAAQVEHWFGPMVEEPGFHRAVRERISWSAALVAEASEIVGGMLFSAEPPVRHVHWLVVSDRARGSGVGRALLAEAMRRFGPDPGTIEVITFGPDHPGAVDSGARTFYERLGFAPAEPADPGPEGGSRQVYRRDFPGPVVESAPEPDNVAVRPPGVEMHGPES